MANTQRRKSKDETKNDGALVQDSIDRDLSADTTQELDVTVNSKKSALLFRYYQDTLKYTQIGDAPRMTSIIYTIMAEVDTETFKWVFTAEDVRAFLSIFSYKCDFLIDKIDAERKALASTFS